ncbi:MAG: DNA polymerase IV [Armatimonadetes bacterium]|nr:DNA polymerase IV [Armatimonadota bacterium]
MTSQPLTVHNWSRAILHLDVDAFFTSCEQAVHPELRGKPVVTGLERGIVAAASYEAKARGVERGMMIPQVRRVCPDAIILPSDYETYSLFSLRLFAVLRRFSPEVEEYSIDEAFVDLTGLRREYCGSYELIARKINATVTGELGIPVSIGVSLTKVLAKIASKWNKPNGLTAIPGREIHLYLAELPLEKIWGIGSNTAALLRKLGVRTALAYARCSEGFLAKHLAKPHLQVWHELNGRSAHPIITESKSSYQTISKTRTFTPPSHDESFVFAQLSRNLEDACIKARRHQLAARRLVAMLRTQEFRDAAIELKLNRPSAYPADLFRFLREGFAQIYRPNVPYRSSGVVLAGLVSARNLQYSLFENATQVEKVGRIYQAVDELRERYGKHTVQHGSSLLTQQRAQHESERGDVPQRKTNLLPGENRKQRVGIPVLDIEV